MSDLTPEMAKKLNVCLDTHLVGLTFNEMRFMIYVVSSIRNQGLDRDEVDQLLSFDISGFRQAYGVSASDSRRVFSRVVESFDKLENQEYSWVDYIELNKNSISLTLSTKVKDLIFHEKYPIFNFPIMEITELHSSIALRFFDYLCTKKLIDTDFSMSIEQVRNVFMAYSESYSSESNVRSKLINHSIELINENTSLLVTVSRRCKSTLGEYKFHCIRNKIGII